MKKIAHRFMGMDPAPKNFGWSVIDLQEQSMGWKIVRCGMLQSPLNSLPARPTDELSNYEEEIEALYDVFRPTVVTIERFMNRGMLGASMTEKCNLMIGIAIAIFRKHHVDVAFPGVAPWKNKINNRYPSGKSKKKSKKKRKTHVEKCYKVANTALQDSLKDFNLTKEERQIYRNMIPHVTDATLMSLVYGSLCLSLKFSDIDLSAKIVGNKIAQAIAKLIPQAKTVNT